MNKRFVAPLPHRQHKAALGLRVPAAPAMECCFVHRTPLCRWTQVYIVEVTHAKELN